MGPTQSPLQWVLETISSGVTWPGREADHSPPSDAEVKNEWSYTSTPPYVFTFTCADRKWRRWTKLNNEELRNLHASPYIVRVVKSKTRWARYVARMGEIRNEYKILVGKSEGRECVELYLQSPIRLRGVVPIQAQDTY
jgi:hypothetical protein